MFPVVIGLSVVRQVTTQEVTEDFNEVPINEFYGDGDGTVNIQSLRYPELHWPRDSSPFSTKVSGCVWSLLWAFSTGGRSSPRSGGCPQFGRDVHAQGSDCGRTWLLSRRVSARTPT